MSTVSHGEIENQRRSLIKIIWKTANPAVYTRILLYIEDTIFCVYSYCVLSDCRSPNCDIICCIKKSMWRNVYEETESTLALILVLESRKKSLHIEYIPCIAHFPLKISFS